jgi:hypothetical protein
VRPDAERQMKLIIARQLGDIEAYASGLEGPRGSVILTERNKAAMAALKKSIAAGHKDLILFYGAAHMPDMSDRLEEMGFKPVGTKWRLAWDLAIRANQPSAIEKLLRSAAEAAQETPQEAAPDDGEDQP